MNKDGASSHGQPSGFSITENQRYPTGALPRFGRFAHVYALLEHLAFGSLLERARYEHISLLKGKTHLLLLGEGDGRCLGRILRTHPEIRVDCIDCSRPMLNKALSQLTNGERRRVTFRHEDVLTAVYPLGTYDCVVTTFFLDCLSPPDVRRLIARVSPALTPQAIWLYADFSLPPRGLAKWTARFWVTAMYQFFGFFAGLSARELPPSELILEENGFKPTKVRSYRKGFIRSVVFGR